MLKQEQAKADGDGVRVSKEMVRVIDRAKQKTTEGGRGAKGDEGAAANGDLTAQLRAASGVEPHHVPSLRARDHHRPRQDPHCRLSWSAAALSYSCGIISSSYQQQNASPSLVLS